MYCKNCGKEVKDGVKFCTHCGAKINVEPAASKETVSLKSEEPDVNPKQEEAKDKSKSMAPFIVIAAIIIAGIVFYFAGGKNLLTNRGSNNQASQNTQNTENYAQNNATDNKTDITDNSNTSSISNATDNSDDKQNNSTENSAANNPGTTTDDEKEVVINNEIQYEANIFLSCFIEQKIENIDVSAYQLTDFLDLIFMHYMLNHDVFNMELLSGNNQVPGHFAASINLVQNQMKRLFGYELSSQQIQQLAAPDFNGNYSPSSYQYYPYFSDGSNICTPMTAGGATFIYDIAVVDSIQEYPEGHQEMHYYIYRLVNPKYIDNYNVNSNGDVVNSDDYNLSIEQVKSGGKFREIGEGTARVVPQTIDGEHTYKLLILNSTYY